MKDATDSGDGLDLAEQPDQTYVSVVTPSTNTNTPPVSHVAGQAYRLRNAEEAEHLERIRELKSEHGDRLVMLAHHYQRPEIVALGDLRGDSFALSKLAAEQDKAEHIVFCGVHFMAESAVVLAREGQRVFHPNLNAGCPMADMVERPDAELAWDALVGELGEGSLVPITYMNSPASVKAFCGAHGGLVCTSSNARRCFEWAFARGERIIFFPDEHLGRNTALDLGLSEDELVLWDPAADHWGGNSLEDIRRSKVILWKGYCHVHTWFSPEHVNDARERYPGCRVVVHPECRHEVVAMADANGSTAFMVDYVRDAPAGSTVVVGTEINLTSRLAMENPDKTVVELARSLCPNMFRISLKHLRHTLENLGEVNEIVVPEADRLDARVALNRMLALP